MVRNTSERKKIVKPYYKYKQEAFTNLVKVIEGVVSRGWGISKPLDFLPKDFVFEITYTLDSFKKISTYRDGGFIGDITYENGDVSYNYYKWEEKSAKVEKKRVELTSQEFKALRDATITLGKLTEEEPADFLISYAVKASENEIARYNPFPGGGGGNDIIRWVRGR